MSKLIDGFTHAELVTRATRWLRNTEKCSVVICEMRSQPEEPDAIGWKATFSTLVECKATRNDFKADLQKTVRKTLDNGANFGMGVSRYYMTPQKLVKPEELPDGWGLLEVDMGGRVHRVVASKRWTLCPMAMRNELGLVLSGLRRYQEEELKRCCE